MKTHNVHTHVHNMFSWGDSNSDDSAMRKRVADNLAAARMHQDIFANERTTFLNEAKKEIIEEISSGLAKHYKDFSPTKKFVFNYKHYFEQGGSRFVDDTDKPYPRDHRKAQPYGEELELLMNEVAKELGPGVSMTAARAFDSFYFELVRETIETAADADPADDHDTLLV